MIVTGAFEIDEIDFGNPILVTCRELSVCPPSEA
jgi:hypothetical protein